MGAAALGSGAAVRRDRAGAAACCDLQAKADCLALRPGGPDTPVWSLAGPDLRFRRGDTLEVSFANDLPVPATFRSGAGIDGAPAVEPLPARPPFRREPRKPSRFRCDTPAPSCASSACFGDGQARPSRARALIVQESESVAVDRDEVVLIEDWRSAAGRNRGRARHGTRGTPAAIYTVNGRRSPDFTFRRNERLRLRFINGCQRAVIAVKLEGFEVRVMAIDGQPAEPFVARNGALLLPPGGRTDVFVDATTARLASPILLHDGKEARPIGRLACRRRSAAPPGTPTARTAATFQWVAGAA